MSFAISSSSRVTPTSSVNELSIENEFWETFNILKRGYEFCLGNDDPRRGLFLTLAQAEHKQMGLICNDCPVDMPDLIVAYQSLIDDCKENIAILDGERLGSVEVVLAKEVQTLRDIAKKILFVDQLSRTDFYPIDDMTYGDDRYFTLGDTRHQYYIDLADIRSTALGDWFRLASDAYMNPIKANLERIKNAQAIVNYSDPEMVARMNGRSGDRGVPQFTTRTTPDAVVDTALSQIDKAIPPMPEPEGLSPQLDQMTKDFMWMQGAHEGEESAAAAHGSHSKSPVELDEVNEEEFRADGSSPPAFDREESAATGESPINAGRVFAKYMSKLTTQPHLLLLLEAWMQVGRCEDSKEVRTAVYDSMIERLKAQYPAIDIKADVIDHLAGLTYQGMPQEITRSWSYNEGELHICDDKGVMLNSLLYVITGSVDDADVLAGLTGDMMSVQSSESW